MDLISVIIPVYNTEKYLDACVESVAGQTYRELEIILVDDGSTDSCPQKCDAWAQRDARVKVIHKPNGGQGEARNEGMRIASGKYIGFADSDDIVSPFMYERLAALLKEHSADMVQCAMVKFSDLPFSGFGECGTAVSHGVRVFAPEEAVNAILTEGAITSTCPSVLVTSEVAEKTPFDTGMINEDVMWIYRAVRGSAKTVLTDEVLYAYYQRDGSTMNSTYSEKRFDALKANRMRADAVKSDFPRLYPLAERAYAGSCMYHYQLLCRLEDSDEYRSFRKRLHKLFCDSDLKSVFAVTGLKYNIWYTLFRLAPSLTCRIRNLLKIGL